MIKIINTTAIKAIITNIVDDLASNYEITTTSTARTSHGRTTSSSSTAITRKPQQVKETTTEPWLIEPANWKPAECRRSDGCKELWGKPRISLNGEISVPVRVIDGDITVNEYTMSLTITVRDQIKMCLPQARLDIIQGRNPWISLDIQRARKLLTHHSNEKAWEELRTMINELYSELNDIATAAASRRPDVAPSSRDRDVAEMMATLKDLKAKLDKK